MTHQHNRRTILAGLAATPLLWPAAAAAAPPELLIPPADRELRVPVRGGTIFVRVNGNLRAAKKPLVLVHGGPGGACWQLFPAVPLATDRAIILYDQLDSGHSDAPGNSANWTIERFASEIDAIRAALDLQEFHLHGHSWGGIVATRYAARQPQGLRSLIVQGSPLSARMFADSQRSLLGALTPEERAIAERNLDGKPVDPEQLGAAARAFRAKFLFRGPKPKAGPAYMDGTPLDRGDAVAAWFTGETDGFGFGGTLATLDDRDLLRQIAAPTLLMAGQYDFVTPAAMRTLLPRLRTGSLIEIPEAGHMIQFDRPDDWRRAITTFVGAHDG
ncbi:alpha/beta fold hydrolase [Sphingomonas sp. ASY06-1R]|uniref:alpha/beta fold hydrolase n=1 Tax=Sphingomonas sp. ASY06-1R TaxID=3445771 RepID=UPI003FA26FF2